jgi:nucleotide-binding universal stress UspA family protein
MSEARASQADTRAPAMSFCRIVVGIDGSDLSRSAFAFGATIAKAARLEIHALHVIETIDGDSTPLPWDPAAIERHAAILGVPLQDGRLASDGGLAFARKTIEDCRVYCRSLEIPFSSSFMFGPLIDRLLDAKAGDMIAVGKGRFAHAGLGSTTQHLLKEAPCPVLIAGGPLKPINRIVGAYDGSPASVRVLQTCQTLADQTHWPMTVLAISGRQSLSEVLQAAQDAAPWAQVVSFGPNLDDEARQIESAAAHVKFGLLAVPAFSDSPLNHLLRGGMTGRLLAHIDAPLLLVH